MDHPIVHVTMLGTESLPATRGQGSGQERGSPGHVGDNESHGEGVTVSSTPSPKKKMKRLKMRQEHLRVAKESLQMAREILGQRRRGSPDFSAGPSMSHHRLHEYSELLPEGESKGIAMVCTVAVMVCALLAALVAQSQVNTDFLLRERIECDRRVHHAELQARRARDDARGQSAEWMNAAVEEEKRKLQAKSEARLREEVNKVEALCNSFLASCRELRHNAGFHPAKSAEAAWEMEKTNLRLRVAELEELVRRQPDQSSGSRGKHPQPGLAQLDTTQSDREDGFDAPEMSAGNLLTDAGQEDRQAEPGARGRQRVDSAEGIQSCRASVEVEDLYRIPGGQSGHGPSPP